MSGKATSDQGELITLEVAGRLLMVGPERIRQLNKAGYIPIPKRGHTTIVGAVQGYVRFLKEDARKHTKSQAASRAVDARASEIELRVAERRRELIPTEESMAAMELIVGEVNKQLTGLPARITRDVALRRKIEAEINASKGKISDKLAAAGQYISTGRDPTDPDASDAP